MTPLRWMLILAVSATVFGCHRPTPVEEVAPAQSGVALDASADPTLNVPWPMWRGPDSQGVVADADPPIQWSDTKNIRFRVGIPGRGHSSPILTEEMVVLATADDEQQTQSVLAYSRTDGSLLWQTEIHTGNLPAPGELHQKGTNANSTVACDGERIYVPFLNSEKIFATALDLSGQRLWQRELGAFDSKFGYAPSPVLYKSFVIFAADNWGGGYLCAFEGKTGDLAWRVARPVVSTYSSPMVAEFGGRDQLLVPGCKKVASYNPATGEELWSTPCLAEATCGTVVTLGDQIFASGGYPDRETVSLSTTGEKLWSNRVKLYEPSLVATGAEVYGITDDGIAYCWSAKTGEEHWKQRLGGSFSASPVVAGDRIYVSNLSGETFVFRATPEKYEEIAVNRLGDDCYASPAIDGDEIYLRIGDASQGQRREQLVCIGQNKKDLSESVAPDAVVE
ncbi:MAG: PQQ-binding-like beta-propeller repeat protein [Planctomycetaceae bacterium]|nr:PQQ-binding-like beta-propeller repeat protein [Planctomycetaceae bacterium]